MGSTPTARMWSYRLTQSVEHMPKLMLFNKLPQRECMGGMRRYSWIDLSVRLAARMEGLHRWRDS
jgi:hypothetical protein